MKRQGYLAGAALALLLSGCTVRSIHPLYTEADLAFDQALIGIWGEEEGKETWTIQGAGDKAYRVIYAEPGKATMLEGRLVRLGSYHYLDLFPKETDDGFQIPAHLFVKVSVEGDTLRCAILDPDWLRAALADGRVTLPHVAPGSGGGLILTADTKQLQEFVSRHVGDPQAFSEGEFRRLK
jgi:hypothetical protein